MLLNSILSSQVVSLPCKSVMEVANFCAAMDTLIDQDAELWQTPYVFLHFSALNDNALFLLHPTFFQTELLGNII